ncbi:MAG: DUF5672 family protein [Nitrososphaerales archaeon]
MSSESYWDQVVKKIPKPVPEKSKWATVDQATKLSLVIVEPRCHQWFEGVLYNAAHTYGGTDVSLYVFHGTDNLDYIKQYIGDWENVQYINMGVSNLDIRNYCHLLTSTSFYEHFKSEHILVFQTDSLFRKPIDDVYFNYDWAGAPWTFSNGCGNGGFSLRRVSKMIQICTQHGPSYENEDIFFSRHLRSGEYPDKEILKRFSSETIHCPDSCGMHKPYRYLSFDCVKQLLEIIVQQS